VSEAAPSEDGGFRPALILTAARTAATVFTFLIPVVLARYLAPDLFGAYKQLFLVYMTLYAVAQVGMAESLYYFLPSQPRGGGRLVANAVAALLLSAVACIVLLTVAGRPIARLVGNEAIAPYLPLLALFTAIMLATTPVEIAMIARRRYAWAAAAYVGTDLVRAILLVGPVLLGFGIRGLLLGALVSALLRLVLGAHYLRREFGGELAPDRSLLRMQLGYALPFQAAIMLEIAQTTLHQYVVSYHFDAATFALYSVGCLQIPFIELMAGPAGNVMMIRMAEARRRGDMEAFRASFRDTVRKLALFFLPLLGVLLVTAHELIVLLFTDIYAPAVPIFRLWCLTIVLAIFPLDGLMRVLAETRYLVIINVVRLVLIAVTIVPLLTTYGLRGPVFATLMGVALAKGLMLARFHVRHGVQGIVPWAGLFRIGGAAAAAAVAAGAAGMLLPEALVMARLAAMGGTYFTTYVTLLLTAGVLDRGEREAIAAWRGESRAVEEPSHA
jgi:O-antigen/teichoic acid export membrane protein